MSVIEIGRILQASTTEFIVGCRIDQLTAPGFGDLVRAPIEKDFAVYGLIYDIRIEEDGLVRQMATINPIEAAVIADNQVNRIVPIEMRVIVVGYKYKGQIKHQLPSRPALSLDSINLCSNEELIEFTTVGEFDYFRHLLRNNVLQGKDAPVGELISTHLKKAQDAHDEIGWYEKASKVIISMLRDDYISLMIILEALSNAFPNEENEHE